MTDLGELYQSIILDHNRSPKNFRPMDDATGQADGRNPVCGDHLTVWVKVDDADRLVDVSFTGAGCAISKASASLMTASVKGKTREEAERLFTLFHDLVTGRLAPDADRTALGRLAAFGGVSRFPVRVKCASLAWHTLRSALGEGPVVVSTE